MLNLSASLLLVALPAIPQAGEVRREARADGMMVERTVRVGPAGEVADGPYVVRTADGVEVVSGQFRDGVRDGRWRFRHLSGELAAAGNYRAGERVGTWQFHREDGSKLAQGKFDDDKPAGNWQHFDERGRPDPARSGALSAFEVRVGESSLVGIGQRLDGTLHGPQHVLWSDGTPFVAVDYVRGLAVGTVVVTIPGTSETFELRADGGLASSFDTALVLGYDELGRPKRLGTPSPATAGTGIDAKRLHTMRGVIAPPFVAEPTAARLALARVLERPDSPLTVAGVLPSALLGAALDELCALDFHEQDARARAELIVKRVLIPLTPGFTFGFDFAAGTDAAHVEQNRLALARAVVAFVLLADTPAYFAIDAHVATPRAALATRLSGRRWRQSLETWLGVVPGPSRVAPSADVALEPFIEGAVRWLASAQADDGTWSPDSAWPEHRAGVTSVALQALIGSGVRPGEGPHGDVAARGLVALLEAQERNPGPHVGRVTIPASEGGSGFFAYAWIYDHVSATRAFADALAVAWTPALEDGLRAAVGLLERAQNPGSGWRYDVPPTGASDMSVTGWAVEALVAAERAGVELGPGWREDARRFVEGMIDPATGRIGYDSKGSVSARMEDVNMDVPREGAEPMTALGILTYWRTSDGRDTGAVLRGPIALLVANPPRWSSFPSPALDPWYAYQGLRALRPIGGKPLDVWVAAARGTLVSSIAQSTGPVGSLDPIGPWGRIGGRVVATAHALLLALELSS